MKGARAVGVVFTLLLALVAPSPAEACSCTPTTPKQAFAQADAVFLGRVRAIESKPEPRADGGTRESLQVRVEVLTTWKGRTGDEVLIVLGGDPCPYAFRTYDFIGEDYVIYASAVPARGKGAPQAVRRFTASRCGRTAPEGMAGEDLAWLETRRKSTPARTPRR
jgi:hypothetical protein